MIMPDSTCWPPKRFTPRRWPPESRPLREEPPAFLCAMTSLLIPAPLLLGALLLGRGLAFALGGFRLAFGLRFKLGRLRGLGAAGEDFLDAQYGEVLGGPWC